jgi:hypothetical protein
MPQRHRPELSESVSGEHLVTYRRTARTFSAGRTCSTAGCLTVLSIYNSGKHCAAHAAHRLSVDLSPARQSLVVVSAVA